MTKNQIIEQIMQAPHEDIPDIFSCVLAMATDIGLAKSLFRFEEQNDHVTVDEAKAQMEDWL